MSEVPAIRIDISPSIHPDYLLPAGKVLNVEGTVGQTSYSLAREALTALYETAGQTNDTIDTYLASLPKPAPTKNRVMNAPPPPLPQELIDACSAAFNRAASTLDARMKLLEKHREMLGERVNAAVASPEDSSNSARRVEIRNYMRTIAPTQRAQTVEAAIKDKDGETLAAIFAAQPFLSGLKPEQATALRDLAAAALAPTDFAQLNALNEAIARIEHAAQLFVDQQKAIRSRHDAKKEAAKAATKKLAAGGAK